MTNIPPVTKHLLIINFLLWFATIVLKRTAGIDLQDWLGLHFWRAADFNAAQFITYMFMHDTSGIAHVFFNMFTLFMFGPILERTWGSKRFFMFYMVCGMGAALVQEGVWALTWEHDYISDLARLNGLTFDHMEQALYAAIANHDMSLIQNMEMVKNSYITVGASGAIFGLLLGFAFVFPNMPLYLFFIPIPIKAKWMVIGYGVLEFFLGVSGGGTVAHFAHLGGMLFGLIILLIWRRKGTLHGNGFY